MQVDANFAGVAILWGTRMVRSGLPVDGAEGYVIRPEVGGLGVGPVAFVVGLALVGAAEVLWVCFPPPSPATLSWPGLALFAAIYISASIAMFLAGLGTLCWLLGSLFELPFREIGWRSWAAVVWMPLWTLAGHERSPWVTGVSVVAAGLAVASLRGFGGGGVVRVEAEAAEGRQALFGGGLGIAAAAGRAGIRWAVLVAVALQGGVVLFVLERYLAAGLLLAGAAVYLFWQLWRRRWVRSELVECTWGAAGWLMKTVVPVALTACALVPFSKDAALAGAFADWLGFRLNAPPPVVKEEARPKGRFFSGIILVAPVKPKQIVAPSPVSARITAGEPARKPMEIEFDGVYWYFEQAYDRPLEDAPRVHGDASRNTIHSTNNVPLAMVANQSLTGPVGTDCCSELRVAIVSREGNGLGPIKLEVSLRDSAVRGQAGLVSLGNAVVQSSTREGAGVDGVEEVVVFPMPKQAGITKFDGITVAIEPMDWRVARGAHIAIEKFVLAP